MSRNEMSSGLDRCQGCTLVCLIALVCVIADCVVSVSFRNLHNAPVIRLAFAVALTLA